MGWSGPAPAEPFALVSSSEEPARSWGRASMTSSAPDHGGAGDVVRVAVMANCLAWGWSGIPRYVARLAEELAKRSDLELTLLASTRGDVGRVPGVREANRRLKGGALWRNGHVAPWLARNRPHVLWVPETLSPIWSPVPTVVTVHDLGAVRMPDIKPWRHRLAFRSARRTSRAARHVIAVSQSTAQDLQGLWGIPPSRITVIPNGVDDIFRPGDRSAALDAVRRRWGIPAGRIALFVGTIEPRKGLDVLLDAAAHADATGLDMQFVLAGSPGYDSARLLSRAARLRTCRVLGAVTEDELVQLYLSADAVVCPSRHEGFGLTPLEAMACGTPAVIAADSGGLVEVSGSAAVVVRDRTAAAWLAAISEASTRRGELEEAGYRLASRYRWPIAAEATADVLIAAARR